jgi:NADH-quinone oxidoreductase subunit H
METFFSFYVLPALIILLKSVVLIVVLLIFVAYILYADRKIWAAVQLRRGPNVVGPWGTLQAFADLLKFVFKEPVIPSGANKGVFLLAPLVSAVLAISAWAVIPVNQGWAIANVNIGILYVFAISSLEVYGVIMGGWASNSKYPFLGALRSAAQMVSYEVSIGFVIVTVLLTVGSLNLTDIVLSQQDGLGTRLGLPNTFLDWNWLSLFPMFIIFFISALAETNRPPFDLVEAESELVAGHMVEYSSTPFLLFFLGEYVAIVLMCALTTILFLGGWLPPFDFAPFTWVPGLIWFVLKVCMVFFMISMVKAFVPRYRYDQLMRLGWKVFLPSSRSRGLRDVRSFPSRKIAAAAGFRQRFLPVDAPVLRAEGDDQLPAREGTDQPALPWRTRAAPLSERRGTLHRLQIVRGDLPGPGDHHRSRLAPQ